jgi:hypothetical protein
MDLSTSLRSKTVALISVVLGMTACSFQLAHGAGPWYVSPSGNDLGSCSSPSAPCATINGAIGKATSGDIIYVATGSYTGTDLTPEVVRVDRDAILSGGWNAAFTSQDGVSTIDGENLRRGIVVDQNVEANMEYFHVRRGWGNEYQYGNGIWIDGAVTMNDCMISESWGGIYKGSEGNLTLNRIAVRNNTYGGIVISNNGSTVNINNSEISGNGGIDAGGIVCYGKGNVILTSSTISGNRSSFGGGIKAVGGSWPGWQEAKLWIYNSTITQNTADISGGGIHASGMTVTLHNTILAGNQGSSSNCSLGWVVSAGYNLLGDTTDCYIEPTTGDLTEPDPHLGALIGAAGSPRYHPLLSGSPAIDAGNPAGCTGSTGPLTTDQRGASRIGRCDLGAYEYTVPGPPTSIHPLAGTPQHAPPSAAFATPFQAAVLDNIGSPVGGVTVNFSAPGTGASGTFADTGTTITSAVTNESGVATASTFTANGVVGTYSLTATVGGVAEPADFLLTHLQWYVSPSGSGSDCRSTATACATIDDVLKNPGFMDGDTVRVAAGVYTGSSYYVLRLRRSVILSGGWDSTFTVQADTSVIDGQGTRQGVAVDTGITVKVERFTIRNATTGIYNTGMLTVTGSTIQGNIGRGVSNGFGQLVMNETAVVDNMGGGIGNEALLILNNCTVSRNRTIYVGGGIATINANVSLNNTTVYGNTGSDGGGLYIGIYGTVVVRNSIIAGNAASIGPDCWGGFQSGGYNLISNNEGCSFVSEAGDLVNVDPLLGPLMEPNAIPPYNPLLSTSQAIDAGNPAGCAGSNGPLITDQRGVARIGRCDMGAYEYTLPGEPAGIYTFAGSPQHAPPSGFFEAPLQAAVLDNIGAPVVGALVSFLAPGSGPSGVFADTGSNSTTALTDETGIATAAIFEANALAGSYLVIATVPGVESQATFFLRNGWLYVSPGGNNDADCLSPVSPCASIVGALRKAIPGDTIYVASGTYTLMRYEDIAQIDKDITLSGGWDSVFTQHTGTSTLDGYNYFETIIVRSGIAAVIENVTIQNGYSVTRHYGGGVINDGTLTLRNSVLTSNYGYDGGGGIYNTGNLSLDHVTFNSNQALWGAGGAVYNTGTMTGSSIAFDNNKGGAIRNTGTATLTDVTATQNNSGFGGAISNEGTLTLHRAILTANSAVNGSAGAIMNGGVLTMNNCAVTGSTTYDAGGGIYNNGTLTLNNSTVSGNLSNSFNALGGGIYNSSGQVILNNCTLSENKTSHGGGIYNDSGSVIMSSSTIVNNEARSGGGVKSASGSVTLRNTLIGQNLATNDGSDCTGTITSAGYNLIQEISGCGFASSTGDLTAVDPSIGPLRNHGGSTETHSLLPGSPAIDAGNPAGCTDHNGNLLITDQRGVGRMGRCDIGAYEFATSDAIRSSDYFPVRPGMTWSYVTNGQLTEKLQVLKKTTLVEGVQTAVFSYNLSGTKEYYTSDAEGIQLHRISQRRVPIEGLGHVNLTLTFIPPLRLADGWMELGQTFDSRGIVRTNRLPRAGVIEIPYNASFTFEALETVIVPAGDFEVVKLSGIINIEGVPQSQTFYLAEGVGIIKAVASAGGEQGISELVSTNAGTVAVLTPNGGEVMGSGETYNITWEASTNVTQFALSYSVDNGRKWTPINGEVSGGSYPWTVPGVDGNKNGCLVKVTGYNAEGIKVHEDISDNPFTIEVMRVTEPRENDILSCGSKRIIKWETEKTITDVVFTKLFYSMNGGGTWKPICEPNSKKCTFTGNPEIYEWTVPTTNKTMNRCKVKVVLTDGRGKPVASTVSDGYFTVQPAVIPK